MGVIFLIFEKAELFCMAMRCVLSLFNADRLILRPPSPGDLEDILALGADADVMRFIGQGSTR